MAAGVRVSAFPAFPNASLNNMESLLQVKGGMPSKYREEDDDDVSTTWNCSRMSATDISGNTEADADEANQLAEETRSDLKFSRWLRRYKCYLGHGYDNGHGHFAAAPKEKSSDQTRQQDRRAPATVSEKNAYVASIASEKSASDKSSTLFGTSEGPRSSIDLTFSRIPSDGKSDGKEFESSSRKECVMTSSEDMISWHAPQAVAVPIPAMRKQGGPVLSTIKQMVQAERAKSKISKEAPDARVVPVPQEVPVAPIDPEALIPQQILNTTLHQESGPQKIRLEGDYILSSLVIKDLPMKKKVTDFLTAECQCIGFQ